MIVAPERGAPYAITTVGVGEREALTCQGINALSFVPAPKGAMPHVALTYVAASPNFESTAPVLLSWNRPTKRYEIDESASRYLADRPDAATLAGIRDALRARPVR